MKRVFLILAIAIFILILIGFLLPTQYYYSSSVVVNRPLTPVERTLTEIKNWQKWWPGEKNGDSAFHFFDRPFQIQSLLINGFTLVDTVGDSLQLQCSFTPIENNRVLLSMTAIHITENYPVNKLRAFWLQYRRKASLEKWLQDVKSFIESDEKLYGFGIQKTMVKDPSLVSVKDTYNHFPTTAEIYAHIAALKQYIQTQHATATNFPIIHIHSPSDSTFGLMVAIATDRALPSSGRYENKQMVRGFLLEGEVMGGARTAFQAEQMLELYARDYRKSSPAISYQMLVTNRLEEPDTSRWITRVYFPVFN